MNKMTSMLLALFLLGCEDSPQQDELGPAVEMGDILDAQQKSLSKLDPYSVKEGERTHKIETQEVFSTQGSMKHLSKEWVTQVTEINHFDTYRELVILEKVSDREWDDDFIYEFKDVYFLPENLDVRQLSAKQHNLYQLNKTIERLRAQESESHPVEITEMTFHNLNTNQVVLSPPELVKNHEQCKGLKPCQLTADMITYDVVFKMSDDSQQKHTVEMYVSDQAPFFSGIMKQCATTLVPIDQARVLVKQCDEVVDFDF